ncbi:CCNB3 [Branchiostoma lanceolatum]|uniref:CCNB3 protein n=1 Tax=Branchiostoma lanceolatum TaxID=7740 RepID=A0A8J9Z1B2_BRALA|nr:CCNB3 [Branchiostoma lanceolatum]
MPLQKRSQRGGLSSINPQKKAAPLVHHDKKTTRGGTKCASDETADGLAKRRAAFGDITNATKQKGPGLFGCVSFGEVDSDTEKGTASQDKPKSGETIAASNLIQAFAQQLQGKEKAKKVAKLEKAVKVLPRRRSGRLASKPSKIARPVLPDDDSMETESSQESLPSSQSSVSSSCSDSCSSSSDGSRPVSPVLSSSVQDLNERNRQKTEEAIAAEGKPQGIPTRPPLYDYDQENIRDPTLVPHYAQDIFLYMKNREEKYLLPQYLKIHNAHLEPYMRAILVDWLVEVQENFELNHETLYQAVKIVDHYLAKTKVSKEKLQLVGATALFMSCKFDERCPPLIDDFVFICDDAYRREDIITMEQTILTRLDFFLNFPISYRFLRRYAKCSKVDMGTLTLARFVLELALQEYEFVTYRESKLAAGALLLAFKMKKMGDWTPTLEYYSGYKGEELKDLVRHLNSLLAAPRDSRLKTVRAKYSHSVFYEVAKLPPLDMIEEMD